MSQPMNQTPAFGSETAWQQANFEYLTGQLQRVRMLLERHILWLRHRWGRARGVEFPQGVAISDSAADVLLEAETISRTREFFTSDPQAAALDENIRQIEELLEDASQRMAQAGRPAAFDALCGLFGLNPFEREVVTLCAAVEIDPSFPRLFAYAQD